MNFSVLDVHDMSTLWQSMSTKLHREVALSEKIGQNFVYKINENSSFKISGRASYVKLRDLDFIFYDIAVGIRSPVAIWDPDNNSSRNFEIPVENKRNRTNREL